MLIRVGCEIELSFPTPTALVALLRLHPSRLPSLRQPETFEVSPGRKKSEFIDAFGNRGIRVFTEPGKLLLRHDALVEDDGQPDPQVPDAPQHPVQELPDETLRFLIASRYCEVDSELKDFAGWQFNSVTPGWPRVQAICNFVHQHLKFDYLQARANRTALDAYRERVGVCRDFMHLAVTLCRCMNIPARYCTGYLGDIGVPPVPDPMDFSAWFEAYLGGKWHTFDARHNVPRIGRVLVARGVDAADVALTTSFGVNQLSSFKVWTDEVTQS